MYSELTRKINQQEAERLQAQIVAQRTKVRRVMLGSLGSVAGLVIVAVVVYFLDHEGPLILTTLVCSVFALVVIFSVASERTRRDRREISSLEAAIEDGTAIERHIASSLCFVVGPSSEEDSDDDEDYDEYDDEAVDYYFDAGNQRTVIVNAETGSAPEFPSSNMSFVHLLDAQGRVLNKSVRCEGVRLEPLARISRRDLRGIPGLEGFADVDSFTVYPESFDALLAQVESAS